MADSHQFNATTIRQRVEQAGVVGAGGAGFPTHIKLNASAEIYLVNAAECEPLLAVDQQLATVHAELLIKGLHYGMVATGANEGIIALKAKYHSAIAALEPILQENMRIHILPDVYPAGDEVITIWLATGRRVPAAAIPISIGVVVNNVQTLINVALAVERQQPVITRTLTINGAVKKPVTVTLPIGTSIREALALAGGMTVERPAYINGGPMMGHLLENIDTPITKTTGGILVLPETHILIQRRRQSLQTILAMAKTVCEQCQLCTDLCPRHVIGHELSPHLLVKAVNYQQFSQPSTVLAALTCSECSACESYACPVGISPMRINRHLKSLLREQNLHYEGRLHEVDPMVDYRFIPTQRLIMRLDLQDFYHQAPLQLFNWQATTVKIPLIQHIGAVAKSIVTINELVTAGQLIADVDRTAKELGAAIHASISGRVVEVNEQFITLCTK